MTCPVNNQTTFNSAREKTSRQFSVIAPVIGTVYIIKNFQDKIALSIFILVIQNFLALSYLIHSDQVNSLYVHL